MDENQAKGIIGTYRGDCIDMPMPPEISIESRYVPSDHTEFVAKHQPKLREALAELAHEQWSGWMRYMLSKGTYNDDGSWTMPTWAVFRWERQMNTPYAELNKVEQNSDRTEADKFLAKIGEFLTGLEEA